MIEPKEFYDNLTQNAVDFFCGVPDSLLKDFCAYVTDNTRAQNHVIAANEGNAIALACGHYLACQNPALVYMQNSGLGNCVNPLLSLADEEVYGIPLLMLIGLRGEQGVKDEPQHIKQGKVTYKLLDAMGIEHAILSDDTLIAKNQISEACDYIKNKKRPYALIVKKGLFTPYMLQNKRGNDFELSREYAIRTVLCSLDEDDIVVSTTGQISRELYEIREEQNQSHKRDFLTVGSMGHASSIAAGIALEKPQKNVYCFDGDGAFIMHMGALPVISSMGLKNFRHVVFNNEAHDSVGSQPTCANKIDFEKTAAACSYEYAVSVETEKDLIKELENIKNIQGAVLIEVKVKSGARADLGRPKEKPVENKESFISFLNENKTFCAPNSISNLSEILKKENAKNILIFTGKNSYKPFKRTVEAELRGLKFTYYDDFTPNPKADDVQKAIKTLSSDFDIVVAVGGGSAIDFAKLYVFCKDNNVDVKDAFNYSCPVKKTRLIAVPTTAGTGAESTQFAVVYVDGVKKSLEGKTILPDYAIVDSVFLKNSPAYLKACCGADAYCQAIESYWSVNSTKESLEFAQHSIKLCNENLVDFVNTESEDAAMKMALASNFAGKAINISKTTAAHALSYKITSDYNIPHGHAVSLSIAGLMRLNKQVDEKNIQDPRGIEFVKNKMKTLYELIGRVDEQDYFTKLFKQIGLEQNLEKLGVCDINKIVEAVDPNRLQNNPRSLSKDELHSSLL